jgi:ribokinase
VGIADVGIQEGESGVAVITVGREGENTIVVAPGANGAVTSEFVDSKRSTIVSAGTVLAQLEIPMETIERLSEICAQERVPLMLDPAPARALPNIVLRRCAWVTPNESEARSLIGHVAEAETDEFDAMGRALLSHGMKGLVLKLGNKGSYIAMSDGRHRSVPSFSVNAIDSTAAGDTFNGAFAVGLLNDRDPFESAQYASAAAVSVTRAGAQPSMPFLLEVESFLWLHSSVHSTHRDRPRKCGA